MAAAYQTGTATGQTDLLQKLVTWLVAQGWTQNMSQADGSAWRAHLNKGAQYVNFRAVAAGETGTNVWATVGFTPAAALAFYCGTGYNGANSWRTQAGGPADNGGNTVGVNVLIPSGTITSYHFFDDGADNITVVVEKSAGVYGALGWGNIEKAGAVTGGSFFFGQVSGYYINQSGAQTIGYTANAQTPCSHGDLWGFISTASSASAFVRADVDTFTGKWLGVCGNPVFNGFANANGYTGNQAASDIPGFITNVTGLPSQADLVSFTANAANGRGVLLPTNIHALRSAGGYSLLGRVPNIFATSALYTPASIQTIGGFNYMAFPALRGNPTTPTSYSFLVRKLA